MLPAQLYHELKELAEKLGINVLEHNFRNTGIKVKSGYCKVKGKKLIILDKHKSLNDKIELILSCLRGTPHEDIYIVPYLRELLNKHSE
jgi:signal recognition particle subunit SEC65